MIDMIACCRPEMDAGGSSASGSGGGSGGGGSGGGSGSGGTGSGGGGGGGGETGGILKTGPVGTGKTDTSDQMLWAAAGGAALALGLVAVLWWFWVRLFSLYRSCAFASVWFFCVDNLVVWWFGGWLVVGGSRMTESAKNVVTTDRRRQRIPPLPVTRQLLLRRFQLCRSRTLTFNRKRWCREY